MNGTPSHSQPPDRGWIEAHRMMGLETWIEAIQGTWPAKTTPTALGSNDRMRFIRSDLGWTLASWSAYRYLVEWFDGPWGRTEEDKRDREMIVLDFLDTQTVTLDHGVAYNTPYNLGLHVAAFKASGLTRYPPAGGALPQGKGPRMLPPGRQPDIVF